MNIQTKYPTTADEFLHWNEGREGKREFVGGKVVEMMINVTENHYRIASRLQFQLASQLGLDDYIVGSADHGVRTRDGVRFPDVMVIRPTSPKSLAATEPLLLAEILSPSTMAQDFGPKARDYLAIPGLCHYLILSQDEPLVWLWSRDEAGNWQEPEMATEESETVPLPGLGASIDLAKIYAGISSS